MNYKNLIDYILSLGFDFLDLNSQEMLKLILLNNQIEYAEAFESNAWSVENIKLLVNNSSKENDIYFLNNLDLFKLPKEIKNDIIDVLIRKNYFTFLLDNFTKELEQEEIFSIFLKNIEHLNVTFPKFIKFFRITENKKEIIKALSDSSRYDLIVSILPLYEMINKDICDILIENIDYIVKYVLLMKIKLPTRLFKNNNELFAAFFLNGCPKVIECIKYFGYENVRNFIDSNKIMLDKIIEYAKIENDDFLEITKYLSGLKNNSEYLKIILNREKYQMINYFNTSAWSLENQIIYFEKKSINDDISSFWKASECLYLSYKNNYNYFKRNIMVVDYEDINDITNITSFSKCIKIGEDINNGKILNNKLLMQYYKFMNEVKSENIHKLSLALLDNKIDNLTLLFDENGVSNYFKNFLLFDPDYITIYSEDLFKENIIPEYKSYLKIMLLDNNIKKYLMHLYITQDNIKEYFNTKTITRKLIEKTFNHKNIEFLIIIYNNNYELELSDIELNILKKYSTIKTSKQKEAFLNYCFKNIENLDDAQIESVYNLIEKVINSNSYELRAKADDVIRILIEKDNYMEIYNDIEKILTDGSTPEFIKRFIIYKLIYGNKDISQDYNVNSPILKSVSREEADHIILQDLFRISLATNSNNIIKYIDTLAAGEKLYLSIKSNGMSLTEESKKLLSDYRLKIEFLCKYLLKLEYEFINDDYMTIRNIELALCKKYGFASWFESPESHYPLINDSIFQEIFGESIIMLKMHMFKSGILKTAYEEGKNYHDKPLTINKGDFIKGIDSDYLDNIFNYGSLCIEMLGESSNEDGTHLDTDMSLINRDIDSIPELLKEGLTGCTWGDMSLIISKEYIDKYDSCIITEDENGVKEFSQEDKNKTEIFCCNGSNEHYVIRTGFPITYVKAIIASRNYDRAKFIVLKNSFFVPIYDREGNLIYSFKDYYNDKKMMDGLSYYDCSTYNISNNLDIPEITIDELKFNKEETDKKRNIIHSKLGKVVNKYFDTIKYSLDSSVEKGTIEIIDTGSTGRNTNLIGDGDFDFIIRVDEDFINSEKLEHFSSDIYTLFNKPVGDKNIIKIDNVFINEIENPVKIEISIISKNSKIEYSTDMCIKDRLNTINTLYPDKYLLVISNIIYAKKFFQDHGIYKRFDGGFGGVGVENFVLQHGGSFYDAALQFVQIAQECKDLNEFKKRYHIYDFGKNHYFYANVNKTINFPYDDYISNLNSKSFEIMYNAFNEIVYAKRNSF